MPTAAAAIIRLDPVRWEGPPSIYGSRLSGWGIVRLDGWLTGYNLTGRSSSWKVRAFLRMTRSRSPPSGTVNENDQADRAVIADFALGTSRALQGSGDDPRARLVTAAWGAWVTGRPATSKMPRISKMENRQRIQNRNRNRNSRSTS